MRIVGSAYWKGEWILVPESRAILGECTGHVAVGCDSPLTRLTSNYVCLQSNK